MKKIEKSIELGGRKLTLSTGHLAQQADGAVLATYGETVVLATVVAAPLKIELDYFPLTVEYQEKLYAGGRIKGSRWIKRDGRPTDDEILVARLIDRSIRPLFPKEYKKDVQVITTVLSIDTETTPEIVAGIAASAAIEISKIPWMGPVGVINVGLKDGKPLTNPTQAELASSDLDLVVSSTTSAIVMIESGANQVPEDKILEAIGYAQKEGQKVIGLIKELSSAVGVVKEKVEKEKEEVGLATKVKKMLGDKLKELVKSSAAKESGNSDYDELKLAVLGNFEEKEKAMVVHIFDDLFKKELRMIILSGKRADGRAHNEIRPLSAQIAVLPRTHGSAIFSRGETQALSIATIGSQQLELSIETAIGEESKRYIHLYSMPPFATGESGKVGAPSRREIGHGALAERALVPVIPAQDDFPYTIQVVTEILSSNGSTSMASVCGSTLSLMDAGVPIKAPIAGIAMGLIIEDEKKYAVLTDIVGVEDGGGDMDFKIAGSKDGITALQLDVKTLSLTLPILEKAVAQARDARIQILKVITDEIKEPRKVVSKYAPKIKLVRIPVEKIGELVGPGGRMIKRITAETKCQIDVNDDGVVHVAAVAEEDLANGVARVEAIAKVPVSGEIYEGIVKRVQSFGAFVEILPGKEGMVHVSDMSVDFVKDASDVVAVGDKVTVRVKEIDNLGRLNLSMLLDPGQDAIKEAQRKSKEGGFGRGDRGGDRRGGSRSPGHRPDSRSGGRGYGSESWGVGSGGRQFDRRGPRDRGRGASGPHFPTSRFLDDSRKKFSR